MSAQRAVTVVFLAAIVVLAGCASSPIPIETPAGTDGATPTTTPTAENGTLEVHFINVGQSVATLIVGPTGETMLIDSGDFQDDGEYVLQYLKRHDVERLDHFVVSHNDADHIGGNAAIIEYYETEGDGIGAIYDPGIAASTQTYQEYLDAVEAHDVTLYETREGDTLPFEGVDVQVMGPPEPYLESKARNENSIVLKLTYGQTNFLFTGDAEDDQEQYLVDEYGSQLQSTILKAGHHGSKGSTSGHLLDAVEPSAVVISSAYDSRYGHPSNETLQRLTARSIPTYWTATHGDVVLVSDGQEVTVKTQRDATTAADELRTSSPIAPGTTDPVQRRATIDGASVEPATTTPSPIMTDGGTPAPTSEGTPIGTQGVLAVASVHADAKGDDRENLNDEYVEFENTGGEPLDISGWTIADEAEHTYTVPDDTVLDPGATVTLHTGSGTNNETHLYWNASGPIWNNAGDTIIVRNATGDEILRESYP